ncbi:type II 3-dehydroquinate dehydratase [Porphyromonas sp. COT-239 OH1446]|uniref:type II 3-dehydroquinate dehydratase n=1 Tax=Porphyromonas sp. COT-239 OH1446 TaxID=1515613 RepID=UPI00052C39D0|nr:type II 3-dehydroquinate dehydratase [Porphyromonas sp. COT-239 OH1446]KGN71457.1 3-dehydroquinate dehydratase [Porphyromonas sp. COT-239 OH1446]
MKRIEIVNGPNLGRIGRREPELYGSTSFDLYLEQLRQRYPDLQLGYYQSNCEGALIDHLYRLEDEAAQGVILNAGAYTHTSIALLDALRAIHLPVIEVHLSNIHARESYRHTSMIASACQGVITGFGLESYALAIEALRRSDY